MGKSKEILKCFMIVIYMDIFFLGAELMAAYIESKPIKIILCINISCFSILLILTIIKLGKQKAKGICALDFNRLIYLQHLQ